MQTTHTYHDHGHGPASDSLQLTYEDRFLRRKVLTTAKGADLLVDLKQTTSLDHGGRLVTTDGAEVEIIAAPEPLLEITADDLTRVAWHIGNRHTPCQIEAGRLLIQNDPVMASMLEHLGATTRAVTEPFTPEGGAYGHGRTHAHEHGATLHTHAHDH
ncbi:urease accessory protein UreE [Pseudaestuariivita atlantica]|uniref:Urease accessory protein UreE n=1 Tax=Pseudaestuariivita atlantica TaxID=1317121 RepID=A0A0L1JT31_9RHOB|nr:urease accessory protein UreE [Pseudaestuariivita atlantica]KNG94910.1 urease accessory protein UreE [Pseudaestuariivita atlantica]